MAVRTNHLRQSGIWRRELLVMVGFLKRRERRVNGRTYIEIVGPAEVIFCACAVNRGEFAVAIQEELDLTFTPPTCVVNAPSKIRTNVLSPAFDSIEDDVIRLQRQWIRSPELRVEISRV